MCGIVGYIGGKNAQDVLLGGLRRLEYRGYDSAGIVTIGDQATLLRAKGKVSSLGDKVRKQATSDHVGIGHTRWATHGEPSESNAHPHQVGDIYLVHNGIIENYHDLKTQLSNYTFASQTDTEVLAALIDSLYKRSDVKLENAVTQALKLIKGTYGVAVISQREPGKIVVARQGSPLIIGVGETETIVASDAAALLGHTDNAIYLNDGELAICTSKTVDILDLNAQPVSAIVEKIETDLTAIEKQGYSHFLIKEIMEQPQTLRSTLSGRIIAEQNYAKLGGINMTDDELRQVNHVVIVGCGTAYYAGLLVSYYLQDLTDDITIEVAIASELRYRSFFTPKNTIALIVSQSGETADTLACLRELQGRGVRCLGVINAVGSTIAREVDGGVYVHAGPEISVASTKAFTSQVSAMLIFALQLAKARGANPEKLRNYIQELAQLSDDIEMILPIVDNRLREVVHNYVNYEHALFIGRDTLFPTSLEGALKLKELSYIQAEGYAAGELKHGPIALIDDRFFEVVLLQDDWLFEKTMSTIEEINARGGHVVVITNSERDIKAEQVIRVPTKMNQLAALSFNIVQQLFAYHLAVMRGNDVDQPRNLAKSVTVE